jgi:hypothetical protein
MSFQEFLNAIREKIVSDRFFHPIRTAESVLGVIAGYLSKDELSKLMRLLRKDLQAFCPAGQTTPI